LTADEIRTLIAGRAFSPTPCADCKPFERLLEAGDDALLACRTCGRLHWYEVIFEEEPDTMFSSGKRWPVAWRTRPIDADEACRRLVHLVSHGAPVGPPQPAAPSKPADDEPMATRCPRCGSTDVRCVDAASVGGELFGEMRCHACGFTDVTDDYSRW
jgi:hypothetical protein